MDELQISGKRYLSSRRVAKENGYHTDYIGQLIRGGKVKGQKVGRTWYVEAGSFAAYLGKEGEAPIAAEVSPNPVIEAPIEIAAPSIAEPVKVAVEVAHQTPIEMTVADSTDSAPTPISIKKEEVAQPEVSAAPIPVASPVASKIESTQHAIRVAAPASPIIVRKVVPQAPVGLRYVADHETLLPEIARNDKQTRIAAPATEAPKLKVTDAIEESPRAYQPTRKGRMIFALGVVAVVIFAGSAVVSSGLFQTINIQAGNPASVSYTMHW